MTQPMSSEMREYADRDHMELDRDGNYYCRHVSAMTREGLHAKSDIAAELAWRDREIDRLRALLARTEAGAHGMDRATRESLVPCDCGCGRSCCAFCGTDIGFITHPKEQAMTNPDNVGGLPELPAWMSDYTIPNDEFEVGKDVRLSDRMRAYGEQCRAASGDLSELVDRLESTAGAYPEDVFTPLTDEQKKTYGWIVQAASAGMGRHMAPLLLEAAKQLRALSRGVPEGK